jgi:hypothetical protein
MDKEILEITAEMENLQLDIGIESSKIAEARKTRSFWHIMKHFIGMELMDFSRDLLNSKKYSARFCINSTFQVKVLLVLNSASYLIVKKPVEVYCGKKMNPPQDSESQAEENKDPTSHISYDRLYTSRNILQDYELRTELVSRKAARLLEQSTNLKLAALLDSLSEYCQALDDLSQIIENVRVKMQLQKTLFRRETNRFYMVFQSSFNPRILHVF